MRMVPVKSKFTDLSYLLVKHKKRPSPQCFDSDSKVQSVHRVDNLDRKHTIKSRLALTQADIIRMAHDRGRKRKFIQPTLLSMFKKSKKDLF
jgi:hypothetical protein